MTALNNNFTYSAWIKGNKVADTCSEQTCAIMGGYTSGGMLTTYDSHARFYLCQAASQVVSTTTLQNGIWYHVLGTYDGSTMKLYVNGKNEATKTSVTSCAFSTTYIGRSGLANGFFNGTIDEVRIWNRSLSPAEILSLLPGRIRP